MPRGFTWLRQRWHGCGHPEGDKMARAAKPRFTCLIAAVLHSIAETWSDVPRNLALSLARRWPTQGVQLQHYEQP